MILSFHPDINTNHWGPFRLKPEARVTIRNLSPTTPAVNTLVHYSTSQFGIGARKTRRLTKIVTIPPSSEIREQFPLEQDIIEGDPRIGVYIDLEHPHDKNAINNSGAQVHDAGYTSESGRSFSVPIPVFNDSLFRRNIQLSIVSADLIADITPNTSLAIPPFGQTNVSLNISIPTTLLGTEESPLPTRAITVIGWISKDNGELELLGGITRLVSINTGV